MQKNEPGYQTFIYIECCFSRCSWGRVSPLSGEIRFKADVYYRNNEIREMAKIPGI